MLTTEEYRERRQEAIMKYAQTRNIWKVQKLPKYS
jgi:predicted RNA-binding protein Jag